MTSIIIIIYLSGKKELYGHRASRVVKAISWVWRKTFARMGEDWVYLALLGLIMAILSFVMDKGIAMCTNGKRDDDDVYRGSFASMS